MPSFYFPTRKTTWRSVLLDLDLALFGLGLPMVRRTLGREARIKRFHPQHSVCYLWFLGVDPAYQHQGLGRALLREMRDESKLLKRPVYLETSTIRNVPWYQQMGFQVYNELDMGYAIYFIRYITREYTDKMIPRRLTFWPTPGCCELLRG